MSKSAAQLLYAPVLVKYTGLGKPKILPKPATAMNIPLMLFMVLAIQLERGSELSSPEHIICYTQHTGILGCYFPHCALPWPPG